MLTPKMFAAIDTWFRRKTGQDVALLVIVLIFFAGLLPMAASRVIDKLRFESYYTDAAVSMVQSHDYLTPRNADGTFRFRKPPLIYWLLVGSYKLLGISVLSSHIWFLIAGCATIWLSYILALKLMDDIRTARTAALILLSQPIFILTSVRALPDVVLAFFMLMSGYGFVRLICLSDAQPVSYWAAYGGAALAVATKGFLPVLFVIYALVFAYFTSSEQQPFRRIFNAKIIVVSVLVSCSWGFLMFWKYGALFLRSFWYDQIGETIDATGKKYPFPHGFLESNPIVRTVGYFLLYLPILLPWLLCLAYLFCAHKSKTSLATPPRRAFLFFAIWASFLPFVFGLGHALDVRYLLPAIPLLAVAVAIALCQFPDSSIDVIGNQLLNVIAVVFFAVAIFGLSALWQDGALTKDFAGLTIVFLALLIAALWRQREQLSSRAVLSISLFLFLPLSLAIAAPLSLPDQASQIAKTLRLLNPEARPVYVIDADKTASRLRVSSGGEYPVYDATAFDLLHAGPGSSQSIFVLREREARDLPPNSFQFRDIAASPCGISLPKLLKATLHDAAKAYVESRKRHCYGIFPPSPPKLTP